MLVLEKILEYQSISAVFVNVRGEHITNTSSDNLIS